MILYNIKKIEDATPIAMVHFKAYVHLMDTDNLTDDIIITIRFVKASDRSFDEVYGVPYGVQVLFVDADQTGFSIAHGVVTLNGRPWDSEGFATRPVLR